MWSCRPSATVDRPPPHPSVRWSPSPTSPHAARAPAWSTPRPSSASRRASSRPPAPRSRGTAASPAAHAALPAVLADVPVAVLVIDQAANTVIYANTAAVELAGNVRLPVDVDTWGAAAGLTDLGGGPLASSSGPLSAVAQGRPVTGEAVRLAPGREHRAAARADDDGARRPAALGDRLPAVAGRTATSSSRSWSSCSWTRWSRPTTPRPTSRRCASGPSSPPTSPSPSPTPASRTTRWSGSTRRSPGSPATRRDEAVGRNCRFLQGPATDPAAVAEIRAALAERRTITTTLLNYRKDGTAFWNQLSISPVFDGDGDLVSFVGVQTDVTERVRVEREREAAFAAEQAARQEAELARAIAEQARRDAERAQADAERAQGRLALMAEATSALIATLDMTELLDRLAGAVRARGWPTGSFLTLVDEYGAGRARPPPGTATAGRTTSREFAALHVAAPAARPPRAGGA